MLHTTYRTDYTAPVYFIDTVHLTIDLHAETTRVYSQLTVRHNPDQAREPLVLNGEKLTLVNIMLNQQQLSATDYTLTEHTLTIHSPPTEFTLEIEALITLIKTQN